jgi:hypothetical protein
MRERERGRECKMRWSDERGTRLKEIERVSEREGIGMKEADRKKCECGM